MAQMAAARPRHRGNTAHTVGFCCMSSASSTCERWCSAVAGRQRRGAGGYKARRRQCASAVEVAAAGAGGEGQPDVTRGKALRKKVGAPSRRYALFCSARAAALYRACRRQALSSQQ